MNEVYKSKHQASTKWKTFISTNMGTFFLSAQARRVTILRALKQLNNFSSGVAWLSAKLLSMQLNKIKDKKLYVRYEKDKDPEKAKKRWSEEDFSKHSRNQKLNRKTSRQEERKSRSIRKKREGFGLLYRF